MTGRDAGPMTAAVTAAALDQGRRLDAWSLALTLLALAALLWRQPQGPAAAALVLCVLAGLAQRILAARVAFDAVLFRRLAAASDTPAALAELDAALATAGLRAAPAGPPGPLRPLADRVHGALRLLRWQAACLGVQFLAALAAAAA